MVNKRTLALEAVNMLSEYLDNRIGGKTQKEKDAINAITYYILMADQPRPRGEWIDENKDALKCSACGKWVYKPFIGGFPTERTQHYNPNYCAFCGADMRKEGEAP